MTSGNTYATIDNAAITPNSLINVYYAEASKDTVKKAGITYVQTEGALTIKFNSAIESDITIVNVKVVNV